MQEKCKKDWGVINMPVKDHIHQWIPLSKPSEVEAGKKCLFVCSQCSAMTMRNMKMIKE